ncbi:hypothetical protein FV242_33180 [Methylobacterium sp. WL64]|uniref:hypothetical protein n=1 Tax=Methylobacterium sp. WL64 TaxID=2603894 RepID=UPI0011CCCFD5|nr:hypothetical protein [Methylobacterium sp. WL64]TXM96737.1 hypothetical protein FV242_33180 [Methylobacterium sp. WL64]
MHKPVDTARPDFAEQLPANCPPADAAKTSKRQLLRLGRKDPPTPQCFESYSAKGRTCDDDTDPCEHASCSTFIHYENDDFAQALSRLPSFKKFYKYLHFMNIDEKTGIMKINQYTGHVDLWIFSTFDPVSSVGSTRRIK